jgi:hypothetical protein
LSQVSSKQSEPDAAVIIQYSPWQIRIWSRLRWKGMRIEVAGAVIQGPTPDSGGRNGLWLITIRKADYGSLVHDRTPTKE